jgi:hypothetical protein
LDYLSLDEELVVLTPGRRPVRESLVGDQGFRVSWSQGLTSG